MLHEEFQHFDEGDNPKKRPYYNTEGAWNEKWRADTGQSFLIPQPYINSVPERLRWKGRGTFRHKGMGPEWAEQFG